MRMRAILLGLYAATLLAAARPAVSAVDAEPHWRDRDPAVAVHQPPPFRQHEYSVALDERVQRESGNLALRLDRAHDRLQRGDLEGTRQDLDRAAKTIAPGSLAERRLAWTLGWMHFDLGDPRRALESWQRAVTLHGGHPAWAPSALAIAHWRLGDHAAAIAAYQHAVDGYPKLWGREAAMQRRTRHWKPAQREAINAVFEAWQQASIHP